MSANYKDTLNLPQTAFPMKANLTQREPETLEVWNRTKLYERIQQERAAAPAFVLHDGPPFANGDVHIGTALNKILKDFVVKSKTMDGSRSPYVPGWDCHGLPIESKVTQEMRKNGEGANDAAAIRKACAVYARKYIDIQREQFKRLGVLGDWDNPYLTLDKEYEAEELRLFAEIVEQGFVYRGKKPVYWCIPCRTALAEFEVEYQDHVSPSIYVKFQVVGQQDTFIVIWTTTPWTLPANLAIAYNPGLQYVQVETGGEKYILCRSLLSTVAEKCGWKDYREQPFPTGDLFNLQYQHPFCDRTGNVQPAGFVTSETGTGFVHVAPGHGLEDFNLGVTIGLPVYSPVDDDGRFACTDDLPVEKQMPKELVGKSILEKHGKSEANEAVLHELRVRKVLLHQENYTHSYPHCWRSKNPVIFRSMEQWFIKIDQERRPIGDRPHDLTTFREEVLNVIENVNWIPDWGRSRIEAAVKTRPDWCISRQRTWGVPIPAFYSERGVAILDREIVRTFADLVEKHGSNIWFEKSFEELWALLKPVNHKGAVPVSKSNDTLDVWIDSGSSSRAVTAKRTELRGSTVPFQADVYLEGSDQHRGWFQSSLLLSLAGNGGPPYKTVLTHGFMVDADREKISKSKQGQGGYEKPQTAEAYLKKWGADIVRLWVASQDYRNDIVVSEERLTKVAETYMKVRNTFRFMLSNLFDFDPEKHAVPHEQLQEIDRWALSRLQQLVEDCVEAYDAYEFHKVYHAVNQFSTVDLSSFYFDILKDSLYTLSKDSRERRSSQTALFEILVGMTKLVAPILSFTAEEIWKHVPDCAEKQKHDSVHLTFWPRPEARLRNKELESRWEELRTVRGDVLVALEKARQSVQIGKSLEAAVVLEIKDDSLYDFLNLYLGQLPTLFIVSQVKLAKTANGEKRFDVRVEKASGAKCARCWRWSEAVGQMKDHLDLCDRCDSVVKQLSVTN